MDLGEFYVTWLWSQGDGNMMLSPHLPFSANHHLGMTDTPEINVDLHVDSTNKAV